MSIDVEVVVGCRKTTPAGAKTPVRHDELRSTRQAAFLSGSVPELASRVPNGSAEPQRCLRQLPWYLYSVTRRCSTSQEVCIQASHRDETTPL